MEVSASIFWRAAERAGQGVNGQHGDLLAASCCISSGFCAGQMKLIKRGAVAHERHFIDAGARAP